MSQAADPMARQVVLEGTVSAGVTVELVTSGGAAIPVTGSHAAATVALASGDEAPLGSREVEEGTYPAVRLTFTRAEVELTVPLPHPGGGAGQLSVAVDLSGGPAVIEVPIEIEVVEDETTTLRIDLNTSEWVPLADPVTGLVSRQSFSAAVAVEAEAPR